MINTGGKEYWRLIGYFMGRTMEALEEKYGEISTELEETILDYDDLTQISEIYNLAQRSKNIKEFEERLENVYG